MWVRRGDGQEFARLERKENDEDIYYCNPGNPGRAGCNRVGARIQSTNWPAKTRASDGHATADVTTACRRGVAPRAFQPGGNPLQMLNPWAPARYGTWVESTSFDPDHPGKWNGIKLFEIIF